MINQSDILARLGQGGAPMALEISCVAEFMPSALELTTAFERGGDRGDRGDPAGVVIDRGVAIVPVHGMLLAEDNWISSYLGWSTYGGLRQAAAMLGARDDIAAVVLHVNSPGGVAYGVREVYQAFAALEAPVYSVVQGLAASAGYWIASVASEISATETGRVGSIGIIAQGLTPVQPGFDGDQGWVIRSSNAAAKNPDGLTEDGQARIVAGLDRLEAMFVEDVATGRGISADAVTSIEGGVLMAADAIAAGLADRIETPEARIAEIFVQHATAETGAPMRRRAQSAKARARVAQAQVSIT